VDQAGKTFTSEGADGRSWIGRIIIAVILGEAIWGLIVSVMNNLVVPWLGDVMGQSAGLPTSFTQRPYNYPDLFVSVLEFCIAGLVAAVLNYFFQRPAVAAVKIVKSPVAAAPTGPVRVVPRAAAAPAPAHTGMTPNASLIAPSAPAAKPDPVIPSAPVAVAPAAPVAPAAVARLVTPPAPAVANSVAAKPLPPAPKAEPAKPKKPKEVYYNIVGEPMPSDED
jgi:large-conductance mechanosensitive channel